MTVLIKNITTLAGVQDPAAALRGKELAEFPLLRNAWLLVEDGIIAGMGSMDNSEIPGASSVINAEGSLVLPSWCDSHTHLVFATSREEEFVDKIRGMSYAEIAARGGGILNSAKKLNAMSEDELFNLAWKRLEDVRAMGTAAIEIKSGYGLTVEGELKMLRVIRKLKERSPLIIRATFLGAHTYPPEFRDNHEGYLKILEDEILPVIAGEKLADFIDVFCEEGFFSAEETERICKEGKRYGLKPKIHANQLSLSGGVQTGVKLGALSVDHLETMDDDAIQSLASSSTIGTLLPTAAFFLRMPFQPARAIIDAGAAVALATDFNPGSSPSANMNLVVSMACIGMRMLPEEAMNGATINGAFAMDIAGEAGSIAVGKRAFLNICPAVTSISYLPYSFGQQHIKPLNV